MGVPRGSVRPVIAQSWQRAELSGVDPGTPIDRSGIEDVDRRSRLIAAAEPVLTEVATALEGTGYVVALADRRARLVDLRYGRRVLRSRLEAIGVVRGRVVGEESIGTNSIATAIEVGSGVAVRGEEHYAESLRRFSCYGHPVIHPATRRIEGVLDITCLVGDDTPLLAPFLIRAARQIEERLLAGVRMGQQQMLDAFRDAARGGRTGPVLAVGSDLLLANHAAADLLDAGDHAMFRGLAEERAGSARSLRVQLSSGRDVSLSFSRIADGALFTFQPTPSRQTVQATPQTLHPVLVHGEPGAGRTYHATQLAGDAGTAVWLDAGDVSFLGAQPWSAQLDSAVASSSVVVVESVDLLPDHLARAVARVVDRSRARIVLTSGPAEELSGEHQGLLAHVVQRVKLVPLRHRREEIPALTRSILAELHAPAELRLTPAALEALAGHAWPGNVRELHSVLRQVVASRGVGDVAVRDLPEQYQGRAQTRRLSPLEQAEREAVIDALRRSGGNKTKAALQLGIGRPTLYRAIRRYGIVAPAVTK